MVTTGTNTVNPAGSPKITPAPGSAAEKEFERFEQLAGKLVQVPKSEVDEKRKSG